MDNKITTSSLSAMLALSTDLSGSLCEDFLRELFALITDELQKGETVRIKGLGTFKTIEIESRKSVDVATGEENLIPAHKRVVFVASKELAALVNSPFEMFEAVEISDQLPTDLLTSEDPEDIAEEYFMPSDFSSLNREETRLEEPYDEKKVVSESEKENKPGDNVISFAEEETSHVEDRCSEAMQKEEKYDSEEILSTDEERDPENEDELYIEDPVSREADDVSNGTDKLAWNTFSENQPFIDEEETEDINANQSDSVSEEAYPDEEVEEENVDEKRRKGRFGVGFLVGFGCAVLVGALLMFLSMKYDVLTKEMSAMMGKEEILTVDEPDNMESGAGHMGNTITDTMYGNPNGVSVAEEGDPVPTPVSDVPVYDVVSTTRYLTTMAQEHYGNYNLWPIIYQENEKILGHPNRITPGTQVVIPPLSKYHVDPANPEDIKRIKGEGDKIYDRFK